jgi:hypothetical protein
MICSALLSDAPLHRDCKNLLKKLKWSETESNCCLRRNYTSIIYITKYQKHSSLLSLLPQIYKSCPKSEHELPSAYHVMFFFLFNELRLEVIICFVDIG